MGPLVPEEALSLYHSRLLEDKRQHLVGKNILFKRDMDLLTSFDAKPEKLGWYTPVFVTAVEMGRYYPPGGGIAHSSTFLVTPLLRILYQEKLWWIEPLGADVKVMSCDPNPDPVDEKVLDRA